MNRITIESDNWGIKSVIGSPEKDIRFALENLQEVLGKYNLTLTYKIGHKNKDY